MWCLPLLLPALAFAVPGDVAVERWPDGAEAAVSVTADDGYSAYWRLLAPMLEERGLRGTFFVVTAWVDADDLWPYWDVVVAGGHELGSHSRDHLPWDELDAAAAAVDLDASRRALVDRYGYDHGRSFAHPSPPEAVHGLLVQEAGYHAARDGGDGVEGSSPADAWAVIAWTPAADAGVDDLVARLDEAEDSGGWLVLRSQGVHDPADPRGPNHEGSEPVDVDVWAGFLDALSDRPVWVAPFGDVAAYAAARDAVRIDDVQLDGALSFAVDGAGEAGVQLSVELPASWTDVEVSLGGEAPVTLSAAEASSLVVHPPTTVWIAPAGDGRVPSPAVGEPPAGCAVGGGGGGLLVLLLLVRRRRALALSLAALPLSLSACTYGVPADLEPMQELAVGDSCSVAAQCMEHDACVDGACGSCSVDAQCRPGEHCADGFCLAPPPRWELTVDPDAFAEIQLPDNRIEDLWIDGQLATTDRDYGACRVRIRGGSSRFFPKVSLRLEFPEDAEHPGYARKINLRSEYNDYSYVRTHLAYEAFRRLTDLPTPRHRYVELFINGERHGLMAEVERIGGRFLRLRGRDPEASTYEDVRPTIAGSLVPMADEAAYRERYPKATGPDDYSDLVSFIEDDLWPGFDPAQPAVVDASGLRDAVHLDGYVDYLAVHALLQSHDHIAKNFYFSHQVAPGEAEARWEFYPWDLDLTMGCLWDGTNQDVLCDALTVDAPYTLGVIHAWDPEACFCNMAIQQALSEAELRARVDARICELSDDPWWTERTPALIDALGAVLAPAVDADERDAIGSLGAWADYRAEVVTFVHGRRAHLREVLACDG